MTESAEATVGGPSWVPLTPRERRVLGVMVEKAKTTPEYYPMTIAAIVTACNQKSNRDPVTNYDQDDVEETLQGLRKKGAVILIEGGGRVARWKHTLYDWLKVSKVELAVVAELMLRGPQTEGDLRARASRMEPLADLGVLRGDPRGDGAPQAWCIILSPPGQKRGRVRGPWALSAGGVRAGPAGVRQSGRATRTRRRRGSRRPARSSPRPRPLPDGWPRSPPSAPRSISSAAPRGPGRRGPRTQIGAGSLTG